MNTLIFERGGNAFHIFRPLILKDAPDRNAAFLAMVLVVEIEIPLDFLEIRQTGFPAPALGPRSPHSS